MTTCHQPLHYRMVSRVAVLACTLGCLFPTVGANMRDLVLVGTCPEKAFLDHQLFKFKGHTFTGAPWYEAMLQDGSSAYLYWDPDCSGGGDGTPRWILDSDMPSLTSYRDLDGDHTCDYYARFNSNDKAAPPTEAFWHMRCGGVDSDTVLVDLLVVTTTITTTSTTVTTTTSTTSTTTVTTSTTSTTTSTTQTTTSTTVTYTSTNTTTSTTTTTRLFRSVKSSGFCLFKDFLNGRVFREIAISKIGARVYKATDAELYIYYDKDCDGGHNGVPRWIVDNDRPDLSVEQDLDRDGKCNYHARLDSDTPMDLPEVAQWSVWCGFGWTKQTIYFDMTEDIHTVDEPESPELELRGYFDGYGCEGADFLQNTHFFQQGHTHNGSPYYKSADGKLYIYYDLSCSGVEGVAPRWIVDNNAPSLTAKWDLDNDKNCSYYARVKTSVASYPPRGAMWYVDCNAPQNDWKSVWVVLLRIPVTTTTTKPKEEVTTTAKPGAGKTNAAPGMPKQAALLFAITIFAIFH